MADPTVRHRSWAALLCLGAGLLLLTGVVAWMLASPRFVDRTPATTSKPPFSEDPAKAALPDVIAREPLDTAMPPAALEETLEAHWGRQWPVVREKMLADGFDLGKPFHLVPWSEVSEECRSRFLVMPEDEEKGLRDLYLEWPEELTLEWLARTFRLPDGFSESDLHTVEAIASPLNAEIEAGIYEYTTGVLSALRQKWDRGDFVRAAFSSRYVPTEDSTEGNFYSKSMSTSSGWGVKMSLSKIDYPDLAALAESMQKLQRTRDSRIRSHLAGWER